MTISPVTQTLANSAQTSTTGRSGDTRLLEMLNAAFGLVEVVNSLRNAAATDAEAGNAPGAAAAKVGRNVDITG
ncbi:MAG: hypothetical protein HY719_10770 [Planctomycetes bacterium]|nr:hypothetical protein [Planctomycetota bacterium]